jgi:hypothetical protein
MMNGVKDADPKCRAADGYADPDSDYLAPATAPTALGSRWQGHGHERGANRRASEDPGENIASFCRHFEPRFHSSVLGRQATGGTLLTAGLLWNA